MSGSALAFLLALALPWAYVLPADRVLEQMERARSVRVPVSLTVSIEGIDESWPQEARIDLHPAAGMRVDDLAGGRFVVRGGRVIAASQLEVPAWLPQLELLVKPDDDTVSSWLLDAGVDLERSALGRCGADDCFVLGGREGAAQLWVEKDAFRPRIWVTPAGRRFEWSAYRTWGEIDFPSKIEVFEAEGRLATLRVRTLEPAPDLGPGDFSSAWTRP